MIIKDLLKEIGIEESNVIEIMYISNSKKATPSFHLFENFSNSTEDINVEKGCEIKVLDVRTNDILQMISVHPNVDWTDGTCRPTWMDGYLSIHLNKRFDEDEIDKKTHKLQMGKTQCMQCKKLFYNDELFWINDYQGITYKKVCSDECRSNAINDLDEAMESWGNEVIDF